MPTVIGLGTKTKTIDSKDKLTLAIADKEKVEKANIKLLEENEMLKEKIEDLENQLKEANKNGKKPTSKDSSGGSGTSKAK